MKHYAFRVVLGVTGLVMAFIGLNTMLGGMLTLGWQFPPDVATATDPLGFARHDSNARFFAGVFTGLSLLLALSAVWLKPLGPIGVAFLGSITLGGIARLFQPGYSPLEDSGLLSSVVAELIFVPLLAFLLYRTLR